MRYTPCLLTLLISVSSCPISASELPAESTSYQTQVLPILKSRCGGCHGPDVQEAQISFDSLSTDLARDRAAAEHWQEALHAINAGEMPPEDEPQLSANERKVVTEWITQAIQLAIEEQRSTGGRTVLRRLNRVEYQNTMRDLLGVDMDYRRDLPPDAVSPDGFRNNGKSLRMSAIQLEYYLDTARRALERVILHHDPPQVFRHEFTQSNVGGWRGPTEQSNRLERAQKFLVRIKDDYPEQGEFRIQVKLRAELKPQKGFPILEVAVGYRPDTEVHFRVAAVQEIRSEGLQQLEFRGRIENFPLPVRGQGKYPGLVVRLRNLYNDGTPIPKKLEKLKRHGKEVKAFPPEPDLPALLIESLRFEGPIFATWPPTHHRVILPNSELKDENEVVYLRKVLHRFLGRAYRRPATPAEVEEMFSFFASIRPHFTRFEDAIRETLAYVLIQPQFLYLWEDDSQQKRQVNQWELASRLAYFLWSTMPDERLRQQAQLGLLSDREVIRSEVSRMLQDERSRRFAEQFIEQWLHLDQLKSLVVDPEYYPNIDDELKSQLHNETVEFFQYLLVSRESALNLLASDFIVVNETVARHYGIAGVYGQQFRRIPAPTQRGGLLGQASVLMMNSTGQDSHPIRRAVWIRDRLLNDPPAPPPPDVPELDTTAPDFAKLSVREQLQVHRERDSCRSCHQAIDPWGIALENFDAVGQWREQIRKKVGNRFEHRPVVATDTLPNGQRFDGVESLKHYLRTSQHAEFSQAIVRAMLTFAVGRSLELSDEANINALAEGFAQEDYDLRWLVDGITTSEAFMTK